MKRNVKKPSTVRRNDRVYSMFRARIPIDDIACKVQRDRRTVMDIIKIYDEDVNFREKYNLNEIEDEPT